MRQLVIDGLVAGVHDTADGIGVALAEMAVRSRRGFVVEHAEVDHAWLFAESASRVVVCVARDRTDDVVRAAQAAGVDVVALGEVTGERLVVAGLLDVPLAVAVGTARLRAGCLPARFSAL